MEFIHFELPNGIRCVLRPTRSAVVYCGLTINAGSRDELPTEHGIAHFVEHSLFKGTQRRKAYQVNSRLENLGGELNAFTTKEETVIHATTLRGDFAKAAELIADVVFSSVFPQKEIDKEKEVVADEINSYKDSPAERIYDDFEDFIFADTSLGHNILGRKKSISKFRSEDLHAFCDRTYNTDQMVFSASGALSERRFREICERHFAQIPENRRTFQRTPIPEVDSFVFEKRYNTFQAHCMVGCRAYPNTDTKRIPFSLLVNLLGGASSNSLLNMALRERNGFSYNVEAGYTPYRDTGITTIYFGTDKDKVDLCLELIDKELSKILAGDISSRQFSIAKKQFIGQLLISMESAENNMLSAGKSLLVYDKVDSTVDLIKRIENIRLTEVCDVAGEIYGQSRSMLIYR